VWDAEEKKYAELPRRCRYRLFSNVGKKKGGGSKGVNKCGKKGKGGGAFFPPLGKKEPLSHGWGGTGDLASKGDRKKGRGTFTLPAKKKRRPSLL